MKNLFAIVSALSIFLLSASLVLAHATLVRADPPPNARLAGSPAAVTVWFDEELNKRFSALLVLDKNQTEVDTQDVTFSDDHKQMRVGLKPGLPNGPYTVSYRVLSAVDGHFYPGSYAFTVGNGTAAATPAAASTTTVDWARLPFDLLVRALNLLAALALCGAFTLRLLLGDQDKEFAALRRVSERRLRRWVGLLLALLVAGGLLSQLLQAVTASGRSLPEVISQGLAFSSLTETRFGQAALARLILVASLFALYWSSSSIDTSHWRIKRLWNVRGLDAAYFGMSALILLSLSLSSHAAASSDVLQLALFSDWLHLLAIGSWTGGLFALTLVLRPALATLPAELLKPAGPAASPRPRIKTGSPLGAGRGGAAVPGSRDTGTLGGKGPLVSGTPHEAGRADLSRTVLQRFSNLAVGSVILFSITGLYAMWRQVSSPNALIATAYGETLIIKHIFIVPLILLGAVNTLLLRGWRLPPAFASLSAWLRRLKLIPEQAGANPVAAVLHNVRFEAGLGLLVIIAAAGMTSLPPARSALPPAAPAALAMRQGTDFSAAMTINPFATGNARFELALNDAQGKPLPNVSGVSLRFTSPNTPTPVSVEATAAAAGIYAAQGDYLNAVGLWRVDAVVKRKDVAEDIRVPFRLNIVDPGSIPPASYPDFNPGMIIALAGLVAGALLLAYALRANMRIGKLIGGNALALSLVFFCGAMALASAPLKPLAVNPYAPDAQSLARGKSLYEEHCLVCHGPTGAGSEFLSADLRPTEFLTNTRAHGDDVLYELLTNGMPGTAMVPWKTRLTDTQRWTVLNYVEFLADQDLARSAAGSTTPKVAASTK